MYTFFIPTKNREESGSLMTKIYGFDDSFVMNTYTLHNIIRQDYSMCIDKISNRISDAKTLNPNIDIRPLYRCYIEYLGNLYDAFKDGRDIQTIFPVISDKESELLYNMIRDNVIYHVAYFDIATQDKQYLLWNIKIFLNVTSDNWEQVYRKYDVSDFNKAFEIIQKINNEVINRLNDFTELSIRKYTE